MKLWKRLSAFFLAAACTLTLSLPAFAAVEDTGFADVNPGDWYADEVVYCRENGLMAGTGDTMFSPNDSMSRGMLATVLYKLAGSPSLEGEDLGYPFADVPGDSWFADAVYWARLNGVAAGYDADTFGPNDPVTRQQMVTMLWQYEGRPAADPGTDFADEAAIADWASTAVDWARESGFVSGVGENRFNPEGTATRAQAAIVLTGYHRAATEEPAPEPIPQPENDVLVAFFSATGNTKYIAEHLGKALTPCALHMVENGIRRALSNLANLLGSLGGWIFQLILLNLLRRLFRDCRLFRLKESRLHPLSGGGDFQRVPFGRNHIARLFGIFRPGLVRTALLPQRGRGGAGNLPGFPLFLPDIRLLHTLARLPYGFQGFHLLGRPGLDFLTHGRLRTHPHRAWWSSRHRAWYPWGNG